MREFFSVLKYTFCVLGTLFIVEIGYFFHYGTEANTKVNILLKGIENSINNKLNKYNVVKITLLKLIKFSYR